MKSLGRTWAGTRKVTYVRALIRLLCSRLQGVDVENTTGRPDHRVKPIEGLFKPDCRARIVDPDSSIGQRLETLGLEGLIDHRRNLDLKSFKTPIGKRDGHHGLIVLRLFGEFSRCRSQNCSDFFS